MPTPIPTKMSQFENVTSLSTASYVIGLDVNGGELKNIKISGSAAGYELARKRWIIKPPVTSSTDTRGADGAESYSNDGKYWIKSGSVWVQMLGSGSVGGSGGTISSSAQLSDGGGFAFDISNNVTFGRVNSLIVTASKLEILDQANIGNELTDSHFITGSIYMSGSYANFSYSAISGKLLTISSDAAAGKFLSMTNGTLSDPAFTWLSDSGTGLYRISNNHIGFAVNSTLFGTMSSNGGFRLTGSLSGSATHAITASFTTTASFATTSSYSLYAKDQFVFNVKDYGALGDDSTDDTSAFNAAIAAIPASGGTLYIPAGTYLLTNLTAFSAKPIGVLGENRIATKLKCTVASGQMFSFSSMDGSIRNLTFTSNVARNELTPLITTSNCTFFQLENISSNASGDLIYSQGGNWFFASDVFVRSDAALGGIAIHSKGQSLIFNNVFVSNNNTSNVVKYPLLWIEGTDSTGIKINNSTFSGGGPLYRYTGSSITSVADKFTITFPSTHEFGINEYLIISGSSASQYHGHWKVAAKSSNTVIISSSLNLGSFSPNLVHSIPCSAIITNKYGAINESEMVGVMFEAVGYPVDSLSCGLFIDGTKSNSNISGWKFNSCYYDYGKIGALVIGGGTTGYNTTATRLMFSNNQCETPYKGISIEQAPGIIVNGLQGPMYLVNSDPGNCGLYLYSNPNGEGLRGIQISNSSLGGDQSWQERVVYTRDYGMIIDGNVDGLTLNNNIIWGLSGSVKLENNTTLGSSNIKSSNNLFYSGSADPSTAVTIPSIASATTISLPWNDQIILTGTTNITTINGGWKSREVQFIVNSGLTFNTGGNIATSKAVSAGTVARLIYDGTNWRHFS